MKKIYEKIKDWLRQYSERRETEERAARHRQAEKYCHVGDVEAMPYIFVGGVPIYHITSQPTDGKKLTVNIDDAPNIVRCIRGKHIKHAHGEEKM